MKALLSKVIAVTDSAHGRLPPRVVSDALGLRDLKFLTHTYRNLSALSLAVKTTLPSSHSYVK